MNTYIAHISSQLLNAHGAWPMLWPFLVAVSLMSETSDLLLQSAWTTVLTLGLALGRFSAHFQRVPAEIGPVNTDQLLNICYT